jgi:hypothetical protein
MGYDLLCYAGEGVELDGAWQDEIDVMEIKWTSKSKAY